MYKFVKAGLNLDYLTDKGTGTWYPIFNSVSSSWYN